MESGGASLSNNLMQKEQSKAISMLVDMETEDSLKRCAIMVIAQKIGLACADLLSTIKLKIIFFCYVLLWF